MENMPTGLVLRYIAILIAVGIAVVAILDPFLSYSTIFFVLLPIVGAMHAGFMAWWMMRGQHHTRLKDRVSSLNQELWALRVGGVFIVVMAGVTAWALGSVLVGIVWLTVPGIACAMRYVATSRALERELHPK